MPDSLIQTFIDYMFWDMKKSGKPGQKNINLKVENWKKSILGECRENISLLLGRYISLGMEYKYNTILSFCNAEVKQKKQIRKSFINEMLQ